MTPTEQPPHLATTVREIAMPADANPLGDVVVAVWLKYPMDLAARRVGRDAPSQAR